MFGYKLCEFYLYTPLGQLIYSEKWSWHWDGIAQLFGKFNWYTFSLANIHCEYEPYGPQFSLNIQLLGFGFMLSINPPWETPASLHLKARCDEVFNDKKSLEGKNEPEGWTPAFD